MGKLRATRGEGAPDWEPSAATLTCSERRLHAGSRGSGAAQTQIHTAAAKSRPRDRRAHPAGRFRPPHVTPQAGQGGTGVRAGARPLPGPAQSRSWSPLAPLALQRVSPLSLSLLKGSSLFPKARGLLPPPPPLSLHLFLSLPASCHSSPSDSAPIEMSHTPSGTQTHPPPPPRWLRGLESLDDQGL